MGRWFEYQDKAIDPEELTGWIGWAKLWKNVLEKDLQTAMVDWNKQGTPTEQDLEKVMSSGHTHPRLMAFLHIAVLHEWDLAPDSFIKWLLEECEFKTLGVSARRSLK